MPRASSKYDIYSGPGACHVLRTLLNSFSCRKVCLIKNYCDISSHKGKTPQRSVRSNSVRHTFNTHSPLLSARANKCVTHGQAFLRLLKSLPIAHTHLFYSVLNSGFPFPPRIFLKANDRQEPLLWFGLGVPGSRASSQPVWGWLLSQTRDPSGPRPPDAVLCLK